MAQDHIQELSFFQQQLIKLSKLTSENILDSRRDAKIRNLQGIIGRIASGEKTDELDNLVAQAEQTLYTPGGLVPIST